MKKIFLMVSVLTLIVGIIIFGANGVTTVYPRPSEWGPSILNWGQNVKYGGTVIEGAPGLQLTLNFNPFSPLAAG